MRLVESKRKAQREAKKERKESVCCCLPTRAALITLCFLFDYFRLSLTAALRHFTYWQEKLQKQEEIKRLKNLKKKEIMERLQKIHGIVLSTVDSPLTHTRRADGCQH